MCRSLDQKLPISLVVSIGTGKMYEDLLGRTDAHQFLFFGKHWLNFKDTVIKRGSNLVTLLGNAVSVQLYCYIILYTVEPPMMDGENLSTGDKGPIDPCREAEPTTRIIMWQSQVENEHYSTVCGHLVISLECFIEITPEFLCPFELHAQ